MEPILIEIPPEIIGTYERRPKPPVKAPPEPETPEKTQAEEPEDKTPRLNHNLN